MRIIIAAFFVIASLPAFAQDVNNPQTNASALTSGTLATARLPSTIAGGSTASSTLTLESTSGVGTTDSLLLKTGSQLTRGTIATGGQWSFGANAPTTSYGFDFNLNASNAAFTGLNNTMVRFVSADGAPGTVIDLASFGASNTYRGIAAGGTLASPSGTPTAISMHNFLAYGYDGSAFQIGGAHQINTSQAWTGSARGTLQLFYVTPNGSTTLTEAMRIQPSGSLSIGSTTDPGTGGLQINGQTFVPNITTSSAAQTGTVCWTTGTGKLTVDTTVGCLTSLLTAKNITEHLAPTKALDIVLQLDPFAFRYKEGWGDGGRYEQFGLGAEQVALVDERLVGRDPNGSLQGVRYQEITAVLAGAVKKLKTDNDNLQRRLDRLENQQH